MLHFFKFHASVEAPVPAREVYVKHAGGRGWPEECPPIRAANSFGFDVLTSFPLVFLRKHEGGFEVENDVEIESDWGWTPSAGDEDAEPIRQKQRQAWFWERGQTLPHPISDDVFPHLQNQVKVSTWLYLATDVNEHLLITDVPNLSRPWKAMTAIVDTDLYPASYPWHCVLELDPRESRIEIPVKTPICRLIPLRRDTYHAREMEASNFDAFFDRGQRWLARNGKGENREMLDITRAYGETQARSRFVVHPT